MQQGSQPADVAVSPRVVFVAASGLEDLVGLVRDHGAVVEWVAEADLPGADPAEAHLLVCPAPVAAELPPAPAGTSGVCVLVLAEGDTTTRAELPRGWRGFLVRRPVHPAALRLLIGYLLYRGPERRREHRVTVGSRIRLRVGGAPRFATLLDLSGRGCRVAAPLALAPGARVRVEFPEQVTRRRSLCLDAEVIRVAPAAATSGAGPSGSEFALRFGPMPAEARAELRRIASFYLRGPALDESLAGVRLADLDPELARRASQPCGGGQPTEERRADPRAPYERRVVARSAGGVHVLLGSDLSAGGMKVRSRAELPVGGEIRLAVYVAPGRAPLVLDAEVRRRGPEGDYGLRFLHRDPQAAALLRDLAARFAAVTGAREADGVIPAELLG